MTNVNNFVIIGRLAADAEDFNAGNNTYTSFRLAVNRGQKPESIFCCDVLDQYFQDTHG